MRSRAGSSTQKTLQMPREPNVARIELPPHQIFGQRYLSQQITQPVCLSSSKAQPEPSPRHLRVLQRQISAARLPKSQIPHVCHALLSNVRHDTEVRLPFQRHVVLMTKQLFDSQHSCVVSGGINVPTEKLFLSMMFSSTR